MRRLNRLKICIQGEQTKKIRMAVADFSISHFRKTRILVVYRKWPEVISTDSLWKKMKNGSISKLIRLFRGYFGALCTCFSDKAFSESFEIVTTQHTILIQFHKPIVMNVKDLM